MDQKCKFISFTISKMSPSIFAALLSLIGAILSLIYLRRRRSPNRHYKLPPGPQGLPIIGNLHMLGTDPHRTLYKMSQTYGDIMSLRLGSVPTIVVSSPAAAELFLKTHDAVFASRPRAIAAEWFAYGNKGLSLTEYGDYWRSVRKFCTYELLSANKTESMAGMRREELGLFVEWVKKAAERSEVVDVSEKVEGVLEDIVYRMLFGKARDKRFDMSGIMHELADLFATFNISDFIPFLRPFDLQRLTPRFRATRDAADKILELIIDDHEKDAAVNPNKVDKDFLDLILSLKNNPTRTHELLSQKIDRSSIKGILIDLIFGAIDTSHTSILWVMSELIRNPRVMKLVQDEVKNVVGDAEVVQESHLAKFEYLDMVVKESMRLHTTGPLLIAHASIEDIVINGHFIPKDSRIIVNNWGIGRDVEAWSENSDEFIPERFVGKNIDIRGKNFQLLPFSSGRRGCPGSNLGLIIIKLVVSQLVHTFNWEVPGGEEVDMNEKFALTLARAKHLLAIPSLR